MKPNNPEHDQQLDELAAGLDAGWDTPAPAATQASSSQPPLSIPPSGEALDALDADWDTADSDSASPLAPTALRAQARARKPRPIAAQPTPVRTGAAPLRVTKQERREAERKRLAHQAQQKSANKQQRKLERQEEARRANDRRRAEQQAEAQRRAEQSSSSKRSKPVKAERESSTPSPKVIAKKARRQQPSRVTPAEAPASGRPVLANESGIKKLIPLVVIAVIVGGTLCFALLRAAGH
jgi:hypothetical protein